MSLVKTSLRFAQQAGAFARRSWRRAVQQERMLATATFALIASTTLAGLDFVVTGGAPDWNPGGEAYAQEVQLISHAPEAAPATKVDVPDPLFAAQAPAPDFSFTAQTLMGGPDTVLAAEPAGGVQADFVPLQSKPFAANRL